MSERTKIFLVDDTEFSLIRTKQFLKDLYSVYTLESAFKMFELLDKVKPDLILLDINMPDVDGYETLKILKEDSRYTDIPVVLLSGIDDEESIVKGFFLGAAGYVQKPVAPNVLLDSIKNNLRTQELYIDTDKNISKLSIIAVDDSPSILRSIQFTLGSKYKVHTLQKPEYLIKLLRNIKPDLFLLDYNMPVINGFELLKQIRELPDFKKTPIVFLTSERSNDHLNEAINLGSSEYIIKPFKPRHLREKIAKCLAK